MKKTPRTDIKRKLMITVLLSSTIPMVLLGVFSLYFINQTTQFNMNNRITEVIHAADEIITSTINTQKKDVEIIGRQIVDEHLLTEDKKTTILPKLYQYMRSNEAVMNMYVVYPDGRYVGTEDLPALYTLPAYASWGIYRASNESIHAVFYPNQYRSTDKFLNAYSIIYKAINNGETQAYVILDVSTEYIQSLLNSVKGTSFGSIQFLIAASGDAIIYNDSRFTSPISFLQNVFRYDRIALNGADTIKSQLDTMTYKRVSNEAYQLTYYGFVPNEIMIDQGKYLSWTLGIMTVLTAIGAALIGLIASNSISIPLKNLVKTMQAYPQPSESIETTSKVQEIKALETQFHHLIARIETYHSDALEKQDLLRLSEIKSLSSQMNPHFLYNTLDSIKWKAKLAHQEDIAIMITELGVLLKSSMNTNVNIIGVREEIEFIDSYMKLQEYRYGDRLEYLCAIQEDAYNYRMPKLLLQPLVENALVHGVEPTSQHTIIELTAWTDEEHLYFSIADNGVGTDTTFETMMTSQKRIGLANIERRIKLHYGDQYGLNWKSSKENGTVVFIKIPKTLES